jgi:acyl carrier protein
MHCAAVIDPALIAGADVGEFTAAIAAKAGGATALHEATLNANLDFFVTFSSIAALLPQSGQASYAAANAVLDAFASWRSTTLDRPTLSIQWGVWRGLGTSTNRVQQGVADYERSGIVPFDPVDGFAALGLLMARHGVCVAVAPVDWSKYRHARGAAIAPMVTALTEASSAGDDVAGTASVSLRDTLAGAPPAERRAMLEQHLQSLLARVLRLSPDRIEPTTPLGTLGLESLMTLELRNRLQATLGVKLSATLVWNHPTVRALATYLGGRLDLALDETPAAQRSQPLAPANTPAAAAELSEEEALRALMGGGN